jgi:hypothetical protein
LFSTRDTIAVARILYTKNTVIIVENSLAKGVFKDWIIVEIPLQKAHISVIKRKR